MKKIILAVAIVCAAAISQAASVDWTATASSTYNGQNLYLLTSIASTYDSIEKFEEAALDIGQVKKVASNYKVAKRTAENDAITKTSNFYLAVVDGDTIHYLDMTSSFRSMVYEGTDPSPGNASVAFANVATSTSTVKIGGAPGPEPIPEPTSGLLLILGMAGLALKRKHA